MASTINASTSSGLVQTADTSGVLQFQTNSGQTAVTIDTSQNVGIGTTSPAVKLDINGQTISRNQLNIFNGNALALNDSTNVNIYYLENASSNLQFIYNSTERMRIDSSGNVGVGVAPSPWNSPIKAIQSLYSGSWSNTSASTCFYSNVYRGASYSAFYITTATAGELGFNFNGVGEWAFSTAPSGSSGTACTMTERMRIENTGNVLVGATSQFSGFVANAKLYTESSTSDYAVSFRSTATTAYGLAISYSTAPNAASQNFIDARDSSAQRFAVMSNGGIRNFSANNVNLSDGREKKDIQLAGSYLDKICAIPVKTFLFNDQTDTDLNLGVIAQDVQAVAPELVTESNWGTQEEPKERLSIYQTDLQYALMKCIQEQQTIINDLKARITALEGAK